MSADNGIYILKTDCDDGHEYRVAHLQAVENYLWDNARECESDNPDIHIANARKMWDDSDVYSSEGEALKRAVEIEEKLDLWVLEYGISQIRIPRKF
jgi:hypothetical protein